MSLFTPENSLQLYGIPPNSLVIDNTKRSTFVACPRKFYWSWVRNLKPVNGSTALRYGHAWHAALESLYNNVKEYGWDDFTSFLNEALVAAREDWDKESEGLIFHDDYRTFDNLAKSLLMYFDTYYNDHHLMEIVDTEQKFEIPVNSEMLRDTGIVLKAADLEINQFVFTGRLDARVRMDNALWLLENKTTSRYMADAIARLNRTPQIIGYSWASDKRNLATMGTLVSIHHLSSRKKKDGEWGATNIQFSRTPMIFTKHDIREWFFSLCHTVAQINNCSQNDNWPMQFDSCYQFGQCAYTSLCEQNREHIEDTYLGGFVEKAWDVRYS